MWKYILFLFNVSLTLGAASTKLEYCSQLSFSVACVAAQGGGGGGGGGKGAPFPPPSHIVKETVFFFTSNVQ